MIKIRDMHEEDVSAVMKIERASFNEPWAEIHFYFDLYSKVSYNWVAESKNELCAYVCFWKIGDEVHINNIAVKEANRRQGIAQKILNRILGFALKTGVKSLTLEVNEHNISAQAFYIKNRFVEVGRRPKYYEFDQADALILTRELEMK
ncbi:MAG: ribosomal protein S18-alanine N-acetyltransferase [Candidatus Marinimicrobia bacterium]|nr:ribosomal protein S18-alanine N-acetyltransferase [Candidatus Neomarinimicrobiota bacterium]